MYSIFITSQAQCVVWPGCGSGFCKIIVNNIRTNLESFLRNTYTRTHAHTHTHTDSEIVKIHATLIYFISYKSTVLSIFCRNTYPGEEKYIGNINITCCLSSSSFLWRSSSCFSRTSRNRSSRSLIAFSFPLREQKL